MELEAEDVQLASQSIAICSIEVSSYSIAYVIACMNDLSFTIAACTIASASLYCYYSQQYRNCVQSNSATDYLEALREHIDMSSSRHSKRISVQSNTQSVPQYDISGDYSVQDNVVASVLGGNLFSVM
eukprot:17407-Heterococcus_DN1.PRE.1